MNKTKGCLIANFATVPLTFIGMILYIMWTQGFEKSVIIIPIWIAFMFGLYTILSWKKSL
ncbi:hypothetical protein [Acinetobacter baumannii]|uniref:hypothetical protein n=1 Tax=Acinetobacter baumannii TaxID=470 RepID=UPI000E2C909B|nr:hypothetical protein [Acinetobacter baumannii]RDJ80017.1 hypothetical protein AB728_16770 [Acinetobacter baumannii]